MSDKDSSPEVVIQNLLHLDLDIRKQGLEQVKTSWVKEYREYVYRAIENEKSKSFQAELVEFVLTKLKGSSLRKMVRFEEKGCLFPKSRVLLVDTYLTHETAEVREALLKSFHRPNSKIAEFVAAIFSSNSLVTIWGREPQRIMDLLRQTTALEISSAHTIPIINSFVKRYIKSREFRRTVGLGVWKIVRANPEVHTYVLRYFFDIHQFQENKTKAPLSWTNWSWSRGVSSLLHEFLQNPLTEYDRFVINSANSTYTEVQKAIIPILGNLSVSPPPFQNTSYESSLLAFWDKLAAVDIHQRILEYEEISYENIQSLLGSDFPIEAVDQEFNLHHLLRRIFAYLPVTALISMLNANREDIRSLARQFLLNRSFFIDGARPLLPLFYWASLTKNLSNIPPSSEISTISQLAFFLLDMLEEIDREILELNDILRPLTVLPSSTDNGSFWPIHYRMAVYLGEPLPQPTSADQISDAQYHLVVDHYINSGLDSDLTPIIRELSKQFSYDVAIKLVDHIDQDSDGDGTSEGLLEVLQQHPDVRIRTRATLVRNKLGDKESSRK